MKKILSSTKFLTIFGLLVFAAGFLQSLILKDFIWLQRAGSLIVGIGLIFLSRTSIINIDLHSPILSADTQKNLFGKEHYLQINESIPDFVKVDIESRKATGIYGPIITLIGTIIWGYADLLNIFVGYT